jgi:hypothetical protein
VFWSLAQGRLGGPAALQLFAHARGNVFPSTHFVADVTLGTGEIAHDYLAEGQGRQFVRFRGSIGQKRFT